MRPPLPPFAARPAALLLALVAVLAGRPALAQAPNALAEDGLYVAVPSPLTSEAITTIRNRVTARQNDANRPLRKVVFDFNPGGKPAGGSDFSEGYKLAAFIQGELPTLTTVAFVHAEVSGHAVLPVLACKEIVMSRAGSLGEITKPGAPPLRSDPVVSAGYDRIVGTSKAHLLAVVNKMADRRVSLGRGQRNGAVWFVDLNDRAAAERAGVQISNPTPVLPADAPGVFKGELAKEIGLAAVLAEGLNDLAQLYGLNPSGLKDDPTANRPPLAFRYTLRGPIDTGVVEAVGRVVKDVMRRKATHLILQLETSGGDPQAALRLAGDLRDFQHGENGLLVVAYVPDRAPGTAAIVALGCSEIVMSKRRDVKEANGEPGPEAEFGDFEELIAADGGKQLPFLRTSVPAFARDQGYPAVLFDGMLDRDLEIVRGHAKADRGNRRLFTRDEFEGMKDEWESDGVVKPKGQYLKLSATRAAELGVARFTVEHRDPAEVYALYGLKPGDVRDATPGWLDAFAAFLRIPAVTVLLVVIGFSGLILELKIPGTTFPGIIAALCFILVFWAHTSFSGQVAVLAGSLFVLGLVLVLVEVFIIPGFGVTGILGIVFMLAGVALATVDKIPETADDWGELGGKVGQFLLALIGAVVVAFTVARYLPNIPGANRLLLQPPTDTPPTDDVPGAVRAAALLGAVGTAVTVLRPAGTVRFADEYIDVVTDGGYIPAGARVQAIEVEGNRIVVKEV